LGLIANDSEERRLVYLIIASFAFLLISGGWSIVCFLLTEIRPGDRFPYLSFLVPVALSDLLFLASMTISILGAVDVLKKDTARKMSLGLFVPGIAFLAISVVMFFSILVVVPPIMASKEAKVYEGITVDVSAPYDRRVVQALMLIKEKSPEHWNRAMPYLTGIGVGEVGYAAAAFHFHDNSCTLVLSKQAVRFSTVSTLASLLVHETEHVRSYFEEPWEGYRKEETMATKASIKFLEAIGSRFSIYLELWRNEVEVRWLEAGWL
jgi:hypothetical protein